MLNSQLYYIGKRFKNVSDLNLYQAVYNDFKVISLSLKEKEE